MLARLGRRRYNFLGLLINFESHCHTVADVGAWDDFSEDQIGGEDNGKCYIFSFVKLGEEAHD